MISSSPILAYSNRESDFRAAVTPPKLGEASFTATLNGLSRKHDAVRLRMSSPFWKGPAKVGEGTAKSAD
jgi:hypothetical protein